MKLKAKAKINIFLKITGVRNDGYHLISSYMHTLSLADTVSVKKADKLSVICPGVPEEKNIAYKAVRALEGAAGREFPVKIKIKKRIPEMAGLGGGSADGAAAMNGVLSLYSTGLSPEQVKNAAESVGADIPFMLVGSAAAVEGIGEEITPMPALSRVYAVIVKPDGGNSTPLMYKKFDEAGSITPFDTDRFYKAVNTGDLKTVFSMAENDLSPFGDKETTEKIKSELLKYGAGCAEMTGSGSAVFGLFHNKKTAKRCARKMKKQPFKTFFTILE